MTRSPTTGTQDTTLSRFQSLRCALVADVLDGLGERHQVMNQGLHRLSGVETLVGRAATLAVKEVNELPEVRYTVQFEAIEMIQPQEVMVVACPPRVDSAFWGELLTTRAMHRGASGVIVDGLTRDLSQIRKYEFPLWARGTHPADSAGRLEAFEIRTPIVCGGVRVSTGDIIVADLDGVVVVPSHLAERAAERAETKAGLEDQVRHALRSGLELAEVYTKYGVM